MNKVLNRISEEFKGFKEGFRLGLSKGFNESLEKSIDTWTLEKRVRVLRGLRHLENMVEKSIK